MRESVDQDRRRSHAASAMGDHHLQLHRAASIEKIALPEKTKAGLFHVAHLQHGSAATPSHEAPAVSIATPRTAAKQLPPGSPRACLCSPTMHAGSFRCRLHRGIGGGGGSGSGSVGSGLHEMSKKKPGVGA